MEKNQLNPTHKNELLHATCLSKGKKPGPGDESQVEDDFHS
jgi:hypothetical protein